MNVNQWKDMYAELITGVEVLDNSCPFINDDNIHCDECSIRIECSQVHDMRGLLNHY